jgi:hypothetical protein
VPIQSDEENKRGQGKAPPSNLGHEQALAPLRDRQERHARRYRGEFPPLRAMPCAGPSVTTILEGTNVRQ